MNRYFKRLFVGLMITGLAGCVTTPPHLPPQPEGVATQGPGTLDSPPPTQPEGVAAQNPSVLVDAYLMGVGDVVQINVWKNPELSVSQPIRPDGKIGMPLIGDVMAAGRKPEELAADIKEKLATYVREPNVTVMLTSLQSQEFLSRIRVTGSVVKNVSLPYHQGMTVLDAVLEAGGVEQYADSNRTKLHRRAANGTETYDIRLKDILEGGNMRTNIPLMPGDIITVPDRSF